jgi:hypothetical protein
VKTFCALVLWRDGFSCRLTNFGDNNSGLPFFYNILIVIEVSFAILLKSFFIVSDKFSAIFFCDCSMNALIGLSKTNVFGDMAGAFNLF